MRIGFNSDEYLRIIVENYTERYATLKWNQLILVEEDIILPTSKKEAV